MLPLSDGLLVSNPISLYRLQTSVGIVGTQIRARDLPSGTVRWRILHELF